MLARFGRISLDAIPAEWQEVHPINPRLLASEIADVLRTLAPHDQPILETYVSTILSATPPGQGFVTYGALADFFGSARLGRSSETIETSQGPVSAASVLIWRQWLSVLAAEATKRVALVVGLAIPANDSSNLSAVINTSPVIGHADRPLPPRGSEPGYLKMREAQQRQEGERRATEQLDAEQARRQLLEQETAGLRAQCEVLTTQLQRFLSHSEDQRREMNELQRQLSIAKEELLQHAGIIAFMDPDNPLSPEMGRQIVAFWDEATESGTKDPVSGTGIGVKTQAMAWWKARFGEVPEIVGRHLSWALTWPDRKKGGMVAKRLLGKG